MFSKSGRSGFEKPIWYETEIIKHESTLDYILIVSVMKLYWISRFDAVEAQN
jgi:hypothetical protein